MQIKLWIKPRFKKYYEKSSLFMSKYYHDAQKDILSSCFCINILLHQNEQYE